MTRMEADEGRVVVELTPQEFHYNPLGSVHGGVLPTLLDTAAGCAVHTTLHDRQRHAALRGHGTATRPAYGPGRAKPASPRHHPR
ncbi:PaaI family thioesterase [Micromonospora sp. NBC_01638]|uniref:PaaI family thioesterase n=1 Tax=Micromonospora sp. NBC_01638 TaxID=2975982 RepID=UPI003870C61C